MTTTPLIPLFSAFRPISCQSFVTQDSSAIIIVDPCETKTNGVTLPIVIRIDAYSNLVHMLMAYIAVRSFPVAFSPLCWSRASWFEIVHTPHLSRTRHSGSILTYSADSPFPCGNPMIQCRGAVRASILQKYCARRELLGIGPAAGAEFNLAKLWGRTISAG
jgi:hypothetical protein